MLNHLSRPQESHSAKLHAWLAGARSRLYRRAGVRPRESVVDLGAGYGWSSNELAERFGSSVVAIDPNSQLASNHLRNPLVQRLTAGAEQLPLITASQDLVFSQFCWLWVTKPWEQAISEVMRVLKPGGQFLAIEPDFGGMMETAGEQGLRDVWIRTLRRVEANPFAGRELAYALKHRGMRVEVQFADRLEPLEPTAFGFLRDLPLTDEERRHVEDVSQTYGAGDTSNHLTHLPYWAIYAEIG